MQVEIREKILSRQILVFSIKYRYVSKNIIIWIIMLIYREKAFYINEIAIAHFTVICIGATSMSLIIRNISLWIREFLYFEKIVSHSEI